MFVAPVPVCRCFMGLSFAAAADAALFLEMVCCNVALARCLRFVGSMGPSLLLLLPLDGSVLQTVCLTRCLRFVGSVP